MCAHDANKCRGEVIERIKTMLPEGADNLSFTEIEMLSNRTYSNISYMIPGKKKIQNTMLLHTFCPICGKKYKTEDERGNSNDNIQTETE